MTTPKLTLTVALSFTNNLNDSNLDDQRLVVFGSAICFCTKISGSCKWARKYQATNAGKMPTTNMPRQPICGNSNGVNNAAPNTPTCQPSAT